MADIDDTLEGAISRLVQWIQKADYRAYEPFDGLSSYLRPLTFHRKFPQQCLQQFVLRFPFPIRPLLGIRKKPSTKAMGFFARGFLRLYLATGENSYLDKCRYCLDWLMGNPTKGYSGYCWGNSFDYQSRGFYLAEGVPTVVWVALIGHAFLDAFEVLREEKYKSVAISCGEFVLRDLTRERIGAGECISYVPFMKICIHNSNMLGAALLSRLYQITGKEVYFEVARAAISYSVSCQHDIGTWYYGEEDKFHWIDSWHTAYNLDSLKYYMDCTADRSFSGRFQKGVRFYLDHFFLDEGTPTFYWDRSGFVDIQCAGQALDSLVFYGDEYPEAIEIAKRVALWTIKNMQDRDGHFYFRKHRYVTNKAPMLHWGQATMLSGLSSLFLHLKKAQPLTEHTESAEKVES